MNTLRFIYGFLWGKFGGSIAPAYKSTYFCDGWGYGAGLKVYTFDKMVKIPFIYGTLEVGFICSTMRRFKRFLPIKRDNQIGFTIFGHCLYFAYFIKNTQTKNNMKKFNIALLLASLFFAGCRNENLQVDSTVFKIDGVVIKNYTIDSCEYIGSIYGTRGDWVIHKGNCKFCAARNNKKTSLPLPVSPSRGDNLK